MNENLKRNLTPSALWLRAPAMLLQDWEASTRPWRPADEGENREVPALLTPDPRDRQPGPEE